MAACLNWSIWGVFAGTQGVVVPAEFAGSIVQAFRGWRVGGGGAEVCSDLSNIKLPLCFVWGGVALTTVAPTDAANRRGCLEPSRVGDSREMTKPVPSRIPTFQPSSCVSAATCLLLYCRCIIAQSNISLNPWLDGAGTWPTRLCRNAVLVRKDEFYFQGDWR